jgi:flavin reductase
MQSNSEFKSGMRRLVAGVCLITTSEDETWYGTVATAVSSVTADPPTLLVCINRTNSIHEPLSRSGVFCVNVLDAEHENISKIFSNPNARDRRFQLGEWTTQENGVPVLVDASASFVCRTTRLIEYNTHTIVLGEVAGVRTSASATPLAY